MKKLNRECRVIAVDYDGTLAKNSNFPDLGDVDPLAVSTLVEFQQRGGEVILWTCRKGKDLLRVVAHCHDAGLDFVSMPHAAFYVVQLKVEFVFQDRLAVSMPHAAFYVVQLRRSQPLSRAGREGVLESRRFFVPFPPYGAEFSPKKRGVNRRLPLCGAGLRQNGKSRR